MALNEFLLGKLLAAQVVKSPPETVFEEIEFSVYSQFGEDGILQFITHHLKDVIENKIFIEIGVQNYTEANTRFLLENNYWRGILIDCNHADIQSIKASHCYWKNNLFAQTALVTRENINNLIVDLKLPEEIGIFSLDIDGNDYWVLEAMTVIRPSIIIVEYNSFLGSTMPVSIPYKPDFIWQKSHPNSYFGASLAAFCHLLQKRGYSLLGCTKAGNNAFFVRNDINQHKLPSLSCSEGYQKALFGDSFSTNPDKFEVVSQRLNYHQFINVEKNERVRFINQDFSTQFNHMEDFMSGDDEDFLTNAYRYLLCREPDIFGFREHLFQMKQGVSREAILRAIHFSDEGIQMNIKIEGF